MTHTRTPEHGTSIASHMEVTYICMHVLYIATVVERHLVSPGKAAQTEMPYRYLCKSQWNARICTII